VTSSIKVMISLRRVPQKADLRGSESAWQPNKKPQISTLRSGRDDKFVERFKALFPLSTQNIFLQQICHLDRSEA
jgi:hypothetical protein